MTENILVTCLLDRSWNAQREAYDGTEYDGTLIDILVGTTDEDSEKATTCGVVLLSDDTFRQVPLEFIKKRITL